MKIFPADKIREADAYTIQHEPIASIDLMERAASACHGWLKKKLPSKGRIFVFCGQGNNGGDGLAIARMLVDKGYPVEVFIVKGTGSASPDFLTNLERLNKEGGARVIELAEGQSLPAIETGDTVIDAIFGSGLAREVTGEPARVIRHINNGKGTVVAIDLPSGLYADKWSDPKGGAIICADYTLSFEFPKLAFMFAGNDGFVGEWEVLSIGLHPDFISGTDTRDYLITRGMIRELIRPRKKFSHKGNYGHALLIAGSYGKMGACILAARACLRSGAGLLHAHVPASGNGIIQTAVPEAMVSIDPDPEHFSKVPEIGNYTAIGIGPGIGFHDQTRSALKLLIQNAPVPIVFDADALTILGENKTWISFLPKGSALTPHPKEFGRLAGPSSDDFQRHALLRDFAVRHGLWVVLKGAHTAVCFPDGHCYFNTTGNPGMATGGSGDVLTGIILGLMAQGYSTGSACLIGVYIHGLAGDLAAGKRSMEGLIAGDISDHIGKAFRKVIEDR